VKTIIQTKDETLLRPLKVKTKVETLIERILDGVVNGSFEAGSCLPSERRLAERLGVSRAIIREAFSALQIVGLIERRSGSGSFIAPVEDLSVLKTRALSILKVAPEPYTVWRAREVFEPAIGEMVIEAVSERIRPCSLLPQQNLAGPLLAATPFWGKANAGEEYGRCREHDRCTNR